MSRLLIDRELMTWEAFASGGPFGYPTSPKIVFYCLSDPDRRGRFVSYEGDNADAERAVHTLSDQELVSLLEQAQELD